MLSVIPGASHTIADIIIAFLNVWVYYYYSLQEFVCILASSTLLTHSLVNLAIAHIHLQCFDTGATCWHIWSVWLCTRNPLHQQCHIGTWLTALGVWILPVCNCELWGASWSCIYSSHYFGPALALQETSCQSLLPPWIVGDKWDTLC